MHKPQKVSYGFSLVETLLLLIILVIGGFIGWYSYHATQKSNSLLRAQSALNTSSLSCKPTSALGGADYVNSKMGYCLALPPRWHYSVGKLMKDNNGQIVKDSDGHPVVAPDSIVPVGSLTSSTQGIKEVETANSSLAPKTYFESNGIARADYFPGDGTASTINGYQAYTANLEGEAPGKVVTIGNGKKLVEFLYNTNSSTNVSICNQIVNSIHFVN